MHTPDGPPDGATARQDPSSPVATWDHPDAEPHELPVAVVLGGSRGLGLLVAEELLSRGHHVVVAARDDGELEEAATVLRGRGGAVSVERCDVRDRHDVGDLVGRVEHTVGPIEVLVTVAGVIQAAPLESLVMHEFEDAMDTMAWGPIHAAMTVLPHMRRRGHGRIGTVTSIGGMVSPPHLLPYATAKFAAVGFSDGLAAALSGTGVTATTVVPGLMRTGGHEHARFGGDAAAEYAWFAPAASLPLLSVDAERAARRIVDAVLAGRPMVVLTPLAWIGIRVRGLAPATTTRVLGLAGRLLPDAPGREGARTSSGREARRRLGSTLVDRLTVLGDRAARRNLE
ncbi:ketoacyl reductase [Terrabacter tumescens]|uniref:Ketoacyl reductase n=1 Tax=Terrabacter tumescens TaxID=60443 RepID=A0ABQ2HYN2_9MICO|nr:SDR family NAD(P)-dependent oxidoreductase [Terrabacter tumescens]GGM93642.1 ketoacyl reductase [Terrabacter tumescens]